jgi:hypothetical protein
MVDAAHGTLNSHLNLAVAEHKIHRAHPRNICRGSWLTHRRHPRARAQPNISINIRILQAKKNILDSNKLYRHSK